VAVAVVDWVGAIAAPGVSALALYFQQRSHTGERDRQERDFQRYADLTGSVLRTRVDQGDYGDLTLWLVKFLEVPDREPPHHLPPPELTAQLLLRGPDEIIDEFESFKDLYSNYLKEIEETRAPLRLFTEIAHSDDGYERCPMQLIGLHGLGAVAGSASLCNGPVSTTDHHPTRGRVEPTVTRWRPNFQCFRS
jgi:hypothetical protein